MALRRRLRSSSSWYMKILGSKPPTSSKDVRRTNKADPTRTGISKSESVCFWRKVLLRGRITLERLNSGFPCSFRIAGLNAEAVGWRSAPLCKASNVPGKRHESGFKNKSKSVVASVAPRLQARPKPIFSELLIRVAPRDSPSSCIVSTSSDALSTRMTRTPSGIDLSIVGSILPLLKQTVMMVICNNQCTPCNERKVRPTLVSYAPLESIPRPLQIYVSTSNWKLGNIPLPS